MNHLEAFSSYCVETSYNYLLSLKAKTNANLPSNLMLGTSVYIQILNCYKSGDSMTNSLSISCRISELEGKLSSSVMTIDVQQLNTCKCLTYYHIFPSNKKRIFKKTPNHILWTEIRVKIRTWKQDVANEVLYICIMSKCFVFIQEEFWVLIDVQVRWAVSYQTQLCTTLRKMVS